MGVYKINIQIDLGARAGNEMSSLSSLSGTHLRCACLCAKRCQEIEQEFRDGDTVRKKDDLYQEDMAYACGAVIASIAFLEAIVNEFFQEFFYCFAKLNVNNSEFTELKSIWEKDMKRGQDKKQEKECGIDTILYSNLETKYSDIVYEKILHKKLDTSSKSWEYFKILVGVRNSLVHFKPDRQKEFPIKGNEYKIQHLRKLCAQNPFMKDAGNAISPKYLLCSDFAVWSIDVSTKFINTFSKDLSDSSIDLSLKIDMNKILQEYSFEIS